MFRLQLTGKFKSPSHWGRCVKTPNTGGGHWNAGQRSVICLKIVSFASWLVSGLGFSVKRVVISEAVTVRSDTKM